MKTKFGISLIVFLLSLGLCVSSIGVTWCRYQVTDEEKIQFVVKGEGSYYIVQEQITPANLEMNNDYSISFRVMNTANDEVPENSYRFHVRWNSTTKQNVSLFVKELSGREKEYKGVLIKESNGLFSYVFVDEDSREALLIHEANQVSEKQCRLIVKNSLQSFGSEIIIIDDAYESEHQNTFTSHEVEDFSLSSNLLIQEDNQIIEIRDEIELTLNTNRDIKTRVTLINENEQINATVNGLDYVEMDLAANTQGKVTLKLAKEEPVVDETEFPQATDNPEASEEVQATEEPEVTDDPLQIEEREEESQNLETEVLTVEETPETKENPVESEVPVSTDTPDSALNPSPETTEMPDSPVIETPEPTVSPETPETPENTEAPETTIEPEKKEIPVYVIWEILDDEGHTTEEFKSGFVLEKEKSFNEEANVTIESDKETFNQFESLHLVLSSDKDTDVSLIESDGFPMYTRYTLDGGEMWFKLEEAGPIHLNLKENQQQTVLIDFSLTDQIAENRDVAIITKVNEIVKHQLNLKLEKKEIQLFEVKNFKPFVLSHEPFLLNLTSSDVSIWMEHFVDGEYVWIDKDAYFNWVSEDNLTYQVSAKDDAEIPNGNYRIVITQTVQNRTVKKEVLSFYAMGR